MQTERKRRHPEPQRLKEQKHPADDVLRILARNIRSARKARGVTQEQLGELADLHRTYVCDVERGARNVTLKTLLAFAQALGTTVSQLTSQLEQAFPPSGQDATLQTQTKTSTGVDVTVIPSVATHD